MTGAGPVAKIRQSLDGLAALVGRVAAEQADEVAAIAERADSFRVDVGGDAIAVNARHAHALKEAR